MNIDKTDIELAKVYLSMNETQRALMLEIMDLVIDHPDRMDFAMSWTGNMNELPDRLRAIE